MVAASSSRPSRPAPINLLLFFGLAAIWGASFLFLRYASPAFGPILAAELRVSIAFFCLLVLSSLLAIFRERSSGPTPWRAFTVVAALNSAVPFALYGYAALHLPAGYLAILNALVPLWGGLLATVFLGERLRLGLVGAVVLAGVGVGMIVQLGPVSLNLQTGFAVLACAGATLCYAIAGQLTTRFLSNRSPLENATKSLGMASLLLLPLIVFDLPTAEPTPQAWASVLALGLLCSAFAYLLFFRLIAQLGPIKATSVTFLIPAFGVLWGHLFLDEPLTWVMGVGFALVLVASLIVLQPTRESAASSA